MPKTNRVMTKNTKPTNTIRNRSNLKQNQKLKTCYQIKSKPRKDQKTNKHIIYTYIYSRMTNKTLMNTKNTNKPIIETQKNTYPSRFNIIPNILQTIKFPEHYNNHRKVKRKQNTTRI